jgi:hypothetical protein
MVIGKKGQKTIGKFPKAGSPLEFRISDFPRLPSFYNCAGKQFRIVSSLNLSMWPTGLTPSQIAQALNWKFEIRNWKLIPPPRCSIPDQQSEKSIGARDLQQVRDSHFLRHEWIINDELNCGQGIQNCAGHHLFRFASFQVKHGWQSKHDPKEAA